MFTKMQAGNIYYGLTYLLLCCWVFGFLQMMQLSLLWSLSHFYRAILKSICCFRNMYIPKCIYSSEWFAQFNVLVLAALPLSFCWQWIIHVVPFKTESKYYFAFPLHLASEDLTVFSSKPSSNPRCPASWTWHTLGLIVHLLFHWKSGSGSFKLKTQLIIDSSFL